MESNKAGIVDVMILTLASKSNISLLEVLCGEQQGCDENCTVLWQKISYFHKFP